MSLLKRSDPDAEAEALHQRVHGVGRTCAMCGAVQPCDPSEVVYRRNLNGDDVMFGRCRGCVRLGDDWPRKVAAVLLKLDADALVLDAVKVERFVDRPGADPHRPNAKPWGHVNVATLTKQAEQAQIDLDHRHGPSPCGVCGATMTPRGTVWKTQRGSTHPLCGRCQQWLEVDGYRLTEDGVRIFATNVLLGRASLSERPWGPPGIAQQVGICVWAESGLTKGGTDPWSWLDVEGINRRLADGGGAERIDPARWLVVDRMRRQ